MILPQEVGHRVDQPSAGLLVHVTSSGVDVAVTSVERGDDCILSLLSVGCLVHTEGDLRNLMAIV